MGSSLNPICQFLNLALKVSVEKQIVVLNSLLMNTTCSEMSYAISFLYYPLISGTNSIKQMLFL